MRSNWSDVRARIPEEPTWYDVFGVPRYGEPNERLLPFMVRIRCQNCEAIFRVCLVDEVYYGLYGELIRLDHCPPCPHDPEERHVRFNSGSLMEITGFRPEQMKAKPLPPDWHYGDPPAHDCVGDTMNSIPEYAWEAADEAE